MDHLQRNQLACRFISTTASAKLRRGRNFLKGVCRATSEGWGGGRDPHQFAGRERLRWDRDGERAFSYPGETTAVIEGICASAATFLAVSCKKSRCSSRRFSWSTDHGRDRRNADKLRDIADQPDKTKELMLAVYKRRGIPKATIDKWLESESTYLTAKEAKEVGLCDEIIKQPGQIKAELALHLFSPPRAKEMEKPCQEKQRPVRRPKPHTRRQKQRATKGNGSLRSIGSRSRRGRGHHDRRAQGESARRRPDIKRQWTSCLDRQGRTGNPGGGNQAEREQFAKEREADKFVAEMKDKARLRRGRDPRHASEPRDLIGPGAARQHRQEPTESAVCAAVPRNHPTSPTVPNIETMAACSWRRCDVARGQGDCRGGYPADFAWSKMLDAYHKLKGENVFAGGAR